jgi:hypothetical protein
MNSLVVPKIGSEGVINSLVVPKIGNEGVIV